MPRLNVYLPQEIYDLADKWRDSANLSEICARAIRDELDAAEAHRTASTLLDGLRSPTQREQALAEKYGLQDVLIVDTPIGEGQLRETLGRAAARYLDREICDGALVAIAGGRQMWCTVRNLSPRRVRATITALGLHHADPKLLHAHPNTLTTLLWLLYSPRSEAHVIGAGDSAGLWSEMLPARDHPSYFVISSCAKFDQDSSFANLLGQNTVDALLKHDVAGDFGYVFLDSAGNVVPILLAGPQFMLSGQLLANLSRRNDTRTLLVAGGPEKLAVMSKVLMARLCNSLITDSETALRLLDPGGGPFDEVGIDLRNGPSLQSANS